MAETGKCNACNRVFQPYKKDVYKLLCYDCLNFVVKGSCPVCNSDLMYQNMGAIEGTWKCDIPSCGFSLDQQVFSSLKSNVFRENISGSKKLHEKIFDEKESQDHIVDLSKINNELNAAEVIYEKFGIKINSNDVIFSYKGWFYHCRTDVNCIKCNQDYYELIRRQFISKGKKVYRRGLVCLNCSEVIVPNGLASEIHKQLIKYKLNSLNDFQSFEEVKTHKKAKVINYTYEAALEQSKINEHLNAGEFVYKKFGIKIKCSSDYFSLKGWFYQCQTDVSCINCRQGYYELIRRPIVYYGRSFLRGLICINCAEALLGDEIPDDTSKKLNKYKISRKIGISGKETKNKNPNKVAEIQKDNTAGSEKIDTLETKKVEIKKRVESALDKLKTTDDIFYLEYYYPKRNEAHYSSKFSINILKLKNGTATIPYFINKLNEISLPKGVAICCVPGSDSNKAASFLRILCIEFCAVNDFEDLSSCLKRNKTIVKSSFQGWDRGKSKTLKTVSLVFKEKLSGKVVVLLDDVAATGNTLLACRDILMKSDVYHVFCLSIGRTCRD